MPLSLSLSSTTKKKKTKNTNNDDGIKEQQKEEHTSNRRKSYPPDHHRPSGKNNKNDTTTTSTTTNKQNNKNKNNNDADSNNNYNNNENVIGLNEKVTTTPTTAKSPTTTTATPTTTSTPSSSTTKSNKKKKEQKKNKQQQQDQEHKEQNKPMKNSSTSSSSTNNKKRRGNDDSNNDNDDINDDFVTTTTPTTTTTATSSIMMTPTNTKQKTTTTTTTTISSSSSPPPPPPSSSSSSSTSKKKKRKKTTNDRSTDDNNDDDDESIKNVTTTIPNKTVITTPTPTPTKPTTTVIEEKKEGVGSTTTTKATTTTIETTKVSKKASTTATTTKVITVTKKTSKKEIKYKYETMSTNTTKGQQHQHQQHRNNNNNKKKKKKTKNTPLPPSLNIIAHRIRPKDSSGLYYTPSSIITMSSYKSSLSSSSSSNNNKYAGLVAISYQDGSIEIKWYHPQYYKFRTIAYIPGITNHPITNLIWMESKNDNQPPLLIGSTSSMSSSGFICIVNYTTGMLTHITPSGGGAIFCMTTPTIASSNAANNNNPLNQLIAIGCEDGIIRIVQVPSSSSLTVSSNNNNVTAAVDNTNNDQLFTTVATLPSAGASILSICWSACTNYIFAGIADGTIRKYDRRRSSSSNQQHAMSWTSSFRMTVECYGSTIPTKVWSLVLVPNNTDTSSLLSYTLVSGDSLGHVQFWDVSTGTLQQSFQQNDCQADVLTMDCTNNGTKLFVSGIHPRVVCFEQTSGGRQWIISTAHTPHSHDVKSICIVPYHRTTDGSTNTKLDEVVISGGIDTKLCIYSVNDFATIRPKIIFPLPTYTSSSNLIAVSEQRLLSVCRPNSNSNRSNPSSVDDEAVATSSQNNNSITVDIYQLAGTNIVNPTTALQQYRVQKLQQHNEQQSQHSQKKQQQNVDQRKIVWKQPKKDDNLICSIEFDRSQQVLLNIIATAMSSDGQYYCMVDPQSIYLFHLHKVYDDKKKKIIVGIEPVRVPIKNTVLSKIIGKDHSATITAIYFALKSPIPTLLIATTSGYVQYLHTVTITTNVSDKDNIQHTVMVVQSLTIPTSLTSSITAVPDDAMDIDSTADNKHPFLPIHTISSSTDGKFVCTYRHRFLHGKNNDINTTQVIIYQQQEDGTYQYYWKVPTLSVPISTIAFLPILTEASSLSYRLAVACMDYSIYIFNVTDQCLSEWNETAAVPLTPTETDKKYPTSELHKYYPYDYPLRIATNRQQPYKLLLGSLGSLVSINLKKSYPNMFQFWPTNHVRGSNQRTKLVPYQSDNEEKNDVAVNNDNIPAVATKPNKINNTLATVFLRYNNMLYTQFIAPDELLVIEQPWMYVVPTLPDAIERRIYGT